jgi:glucose-1-phosphate thymidylyltransferase
MRIIIPMAGMGKRMRPHTLTIPKPLIPVAGKPIVQWLVEDIIKVCKEKVTDIVFVVGRFGQETEDRLLKIAESEGAKGHIFYQDEPLGTAHAILCAKNLLEGKIIVAFADTLFRADFTMDEDKDGIIWVSRISDPKMFGVIKVNEQGVITDFVEKPQTFVSDMAIIGIYYMKDGAYLHREMQHLVDNNIKEKGEFQLTNALENMKKKGTRFVPGKVDEWLDCGNKDATVYTNQRILEMHKSEMKTPASATLENSIVIQPSFIGENVVVKNSVVGPHASIGAHTQVENSNVSNSIVQTNCKIKNAVISNSMIGNFAECSREAEDLSMGDYSTHC